MNPRLLGLGLVSLLAACGFHLQGRSPLPAPLAVTYIEAADPQTDFVQSLRKALLASGARLADSDTTASSTVRIVSDVVKEKVLSVSARNLPREYEVIYTVRFSVSGAGKELLPEQEVSLSRDYSFDERTLLAKENEQALLRESLARDLVGIVMSRLSSL